MNLECTYWRTKFHHCIKCGDKILAFEISSFAFFTKVTAWLTRLEPGRYPITDSVIKYYEVLNTRLKSRPGKNLIIHQKEKDGLKN